MEPPPNTQTNDDWTNHDNKDWDELLKFQPKFAEKRLKGKSPKNCDFSVINVVQSIEHFGKQLSGDTAHEQKRILVTSRGYCHIHRTHALSF